MMVRATKAIASPSPGTPSVAAAWSRALWAWAWKRREFGSISCDSTCARAHAS
ncbi:MAG: hypothetical protein HND58_02700 [Planctomycetota bacterium]|nr:MAG: hypothetical protein HND58_02700 [Planctomycetota bacterium]